MSSAIFALACNILLLFMLVLTTQCVRKYQPIAWLVLLIIPLALLPWGVYSRPDYDWFLWAKTYSAPLAACLIIAMRFTQFKHIKWAPFSLIALLAINIIEAVFANILINSPTALNYMNAITGIALILTIPNPNNNLMYIDNSPQKDLIFTIPLAWIIGYTIWNFTFVYQIYPEHIMRHIVILGIPLCFELHKRGLWLQIRAFSLSIYLIIRLLTEPILSRLDIPLYSSTADIVLSYGGIIWMGAYLIYSYNPVHYIRFFASMEQKKPSRSNDDMKL